MSSENHSCKRIFITGIAGFIGFHLAQYLNNRHDFVIGCDNFNDYYDPKLKHQRALLLKDQNISIIHCDIIETAQIEKILKDNAITHVMHLAAQAGVRKSVEKPEDYMQSNVNGFFLLLETLRKMPNIKLVYASSSSVYGLNQKIPFAESDPLLQPANFYATTKIFNESMAFSYHHLYGIHVTGLRFFTVYGPWGRPDMAYYKFTKSILNDEPITLYHQGQLKRDFTYISDVVKGIAAAIDLGASCEIFNLGNHHPENLIALVECIESCTGKKSIMQFLPKPPSEVVEAYADITKSQAHLKFSPSVSLQEGMLYFTKWFKNYHTEQCTEIQNNVAFGIM